MAKEKISFSEKRSYPVFFMIVITVFFIGILAFFYNSTKARINRFDEINLKRAVLSTFELPTEDVDKTFLKFIKIQENSDLIYYEAEKDNEILGYCFPVSGPGLWGTIDALLTVTRDLERVINIEIIKQNETPGLGGRITEDWFKHQFKGKVILINNKVREFNLIPETDTAQKNQINQITGATYSSKSVVDIIAKEIKKIKNKIYSESL